MCFRHMEVLVRAIFIILVEKGNYVITFPTSTPNFLKLLQYDTSNFIYEIPKHTKKQHISIKTDALSHSK